MLAEIDWNTGTIAVVMIFSIPVIGVLAGAWTKVERIRSDNELKRSMVERGMSVEEMERVLMLPASRKG